VDFDPDDHQRDLLASIDAAVGDSGVERAFDVSARNGYDAGLDRALHEALRGPSMTLLDRVLVAERLAELGTATATGLALALGAVAGAEPDHPAVTVVGPSGLARFGAQAGIAVVDVGPEVRVVRLSAADAETVRSGFGYPYARVSRETLDAAAVGAVLDPGRWRAAIALVRCAEIAGVAAAAVARTGEHLRRRVQFGKSLATFQALRHRLAEAAVSAEAARWLVREAADTGTPRSVAVAAQYAQQTAAALAPELVQLGGARSFGREFGLHVHPMRLEALRLELGGPHRLASVLNAMPLPARAGHGG
jgi:hypothetical protein